MQIVINTLTNKRIPVEVDYYDLIEDLKAKIEVKEGIPKHLQCLTLAYLCKRLEDCFTINDYNINESSIINLTLRNNVNIFVEVPGGKKLPFYFLIFTSVEEIKSKIGDIEHISDSRMILLYNGIQMENQKTLADYKIKPKDILQLVLKMEILIECWTGRSFKLEVESSDSIQGLKVKIKDKIGSPNNFIILLAGKVLKGNSKILTDYNISNLQTINVQLVEKLEIYITLKTLTEKKITLRVESSDSIMKVKALINELEDIQGKLIFEGKVLIDEFTLADFKIKNHSTLYFIPITKRGMEIYVLINNKEVCILEVQSSDTIEYIIDKINEAIGNDNPLNHQRLIFEEEELKSGRRLSDYNIKKESTIHFIDEIRN